MSNTYLNPNNYSDGRNGMYTQPPVTSFYTSLSGSTSNPGAPQMVMNPNDLPYKTAIAAFNNGLLNPNQNSPQSLSRNYYTINSAYGSTPSVTQISRACTGNVVSSVPDIPPSVNIPIPINTMPVPTRVPGPVPTRTVPIIPRPTNNMSTPTRGLLSSLF
jgi:hypothetical protein